MIMVDLYLIYVYNITLFYFGGLSANMYSRWQGIGLDS